MKVFHRIRNLIVLGAVVLCALLLNTLPARAQGQLIGEWPVPGQPYGLAVQAPDVIWATLPSENALVRLVLAPGSGATATTFSVPTANSHPYHIAYAANDIWFTERNGNKIGRLSLTSGTWTEYPIPTAGSQPAGLAVMPGLPTRVWFAESASNRLGLLTVADTGAFSFGEYPVPWPDAKPEELVLHGSDVWFTAAGAGRVARLRPSLWPNELAWANFGAGVGSQPWAIDIDGGGYPWFTERQTHRVGVYSPQTFGDI